jgi:threonine dehydrogenase-like Zn-dependent dehydrogenase
VKTVVLESPGRMQVVERPEPGPPGPGEALVRVLRVGVCGSDLHAFAGRQAFIRYPLVPGHELAVEVVALGPAASNAKPAAHPVAIGDRIAVGDRAAVFPYLADGTCQSCRAGRPNCCASLQLYGIHVDGGMRTWMNVPTSLLLPANDLAVDALALTEMLAVGAHAARRTGDLGRRRVLVVGAGPIGLSTLAFLGADPASTWVHDLDPDRRRFAAATGLAQGLDAADDDPDGAPDAATIHALRTALDGDLPEVVIDATGSRASMERALGRVAHGGRVVFVGHTPGPLTFENPVLHGKELELVASRNALRSDFETVFAALRSGAVDPAAWITTRTDPDGFASSIADWARPSSGIVKAVVDWTHETIGGRPEATRDGR